MILLSCKQILLILRIYGEKSGSVNLETLILTCDRGVNTELSGPAAYFFLFVLNLALS